MNINCVNWNTELSLPCEEGRRDLLNLGLRKLKSSLWCSSSWRFAAETIYLLRSRWKSWLLLSTENTEQREQWDVVQVPQRFQSGHINWQPVTTLDGALRGEPWHSTPFLLPIWPASALRSVLLQYFTSQSPDRRKILQVIIDAGPLGNLLVCYCFLDRQIPSASVAAALPPVPSSL